MARQFLPDLIDFLTEKWSGAPYKQGAPDFETYRETQRKKLTPLNKTLLSQTSWVQYQLQNFPLTLKIPKNFLVDEDPNWNRINVKSEEYGINVELNVFLKKLPTKDELENYLNKKIDHVVEILPGKYHRSIDLSEFETKILSSGKTVYFILNFPFFRFISNNLASQHSY